MGKLNLSARINMLAKGAFSSGNEKAAKTLSSMAKEVADLTNERDNLKKRVATLEMTMQSVPSKFKL